MDETASNKWMRPGSEPFAELSDGTPLYPAYYQPQPGEALRSRMGYWTGQIGERVGVTIDGRLFRQSQSWGGDGPSCQGWQPFAIGWFQPL
jgi:hypothetical protein